MKSPKPAPSTFRASSRDARRKLIDVFGSGIAIAAVILALIPLTLVVAFVIQRGASSLSWAFFTHSPIDPSPGVYPMIVGSLIMMAVSSAIGVPFGLLSGIYLARTGNSTLAHAARFITDVIAGTPSILAGTIVAVILVYPTSNESAFAASVALALLMFPTVTRATEVALRSVPQELREAALALGAPEWKLLFRITIPTAASGIVTAVVLGVARVAGETAPVILTAGQNFFLSTNVMHGPMASLPVIIYLDALTGTPSQENQAFAAAFILFMLVFVLNLIARGFTYRLTKRTRIA